ncbi:putative zinc-binding metallopeptidase [Dehalogenimonas alkenigignens]|uniref:putative zinc-binding metallopeptidase n=1 Tax=Dehalogenimonas alkenigignens TaxID=1217799 RepID=UPI000D56A228|nr:putative zinc-binding metallopeptidase [Dehalogenimonas alkenigignens]PVV84363.1 hypothetical protein DD509_03455 [Dehalogenimonas alkenigignens]
MTGADQTLLSRRIADLGLEIRGSRLEPLLGRLHAELLAAGLTGFQPEAYFSDEWGCPAGMPVIGIPFYLASSELCRLEGSMTGIEAETDEEIMMYLRHEAGHAFNYAHRLYRYRLWQRLFGDYGEPYREVYPAVPFSPAFVRHIPGWYAQKHPDDDFAETFAVWLTPGAAWREVYSGTPALKKLEYAERAARIYGRRPVQSPAGGLDTPVGELTMTLDSWYRSCGEHRHAPVATHRILDEDLRRAFPDGRGIAASEAVEARRGNLVLEINRWTGLERHVAAGLLADLTARCQRLNLQMDQSRIEERMSGFAVMTAALAMNFTSRGRFVEKSGRRDRHG